MAVNFDKMDSPITTNVKTKVETLKHEQSWTTEKKHLTNNNFKALNAIFAIVDVTQFKLISVRESIRDAWTILENAYKGTSTVKISKLQMVAFKF